MKEIVIDVVQELKHAVMESVVVQRDEHAAMKFNRRLFMNY